MVSHIEGVWQQGVEEDTKFGPKDKVTGDWRQLHNEPHDLYL